jgi:uncharacterized protein YdhG (YjbR/CyaY superfamily)
MKTEYKNIDEYIASFEGEVKNKLTQIRELIHKLVPEISETISYQMPTFVLNGNLVHFAGYKKHIGFYPTPSGISNFEEEISKYKYAKGSVQFPLNEELPIELISRIILFRVQENLTKKKA